MVKIGGAGSTTTQVNVKCKGRVNKLPKLPTCYQTERVYMHNEAGTCVAMCACREMCLKFFC